MTTSEKPPASVPARVSSKLALFTPSKELVDAYLGEIAKGYGVSWLPEPSFSADGADGEDKSGGSGGADDQDGEDGPGGTKEAIEPLKASSPTKVGVAEAEPATESKTTTESTKTNAPPPPAGPEKEVWAKKPTEDEELAERFERLKKLR